MSKHSVQISRVKGQGVNVFHKDKRRLNIDGRLEGFNISTSHVLCGCKIQYYILHGHIFILIALIHTGLHFLLVQSKWLG